MPSRNFDTVIKQFRARKVEEKNEKEERNDKKDVRVRVTINNIYSIQVSFAFCP